MARIARGWVVVSNVDIMRRVLSDVNTTPRNRRQSAGANGGMKLRGAPSTVDR
jgi:hypothetical protein